MKRLQHRGSTWFLRAVVTLIGLAVLAVAVIVLPVGIRAEDAGGYRPILMAMYLPAIPFYIALYHIFKLLGHIDHNRAFSTAAVGSLNVIKYCAASISAIYAVMLPYIFIVADRDDAPGVVLLGLILTFGPLVVAVFAAVLQQLFSRAIAIKTTNDQLV